MSARGQGQGLAGLACRLDLPVQDPLDGHGTPVPAARGRDAAAVQPVGDLAERRALILHRQDEWSRPAARLSALAVFAALPLAALAVGADPGKRHSSQRQARN
jgi:hypothetical protein